MNVLRRTTLIFIIFIVAKQKLIVLHKVQLVWLATLVCVCFFLSIVVPEENTDVNTSLINDKPTRKIGTNNNLDFALWKY